MQNRGIIDQTRPDQTNPIVRNSSLELLRIVAMLMIIGGHLGQNGGFSFPIDSISLNRFWRQFIMLGGQRGNDMFVFLSGYFLILSQGIKFRKIISLLSETLFYGLLVAIAAVISGEDAPSLKLLVRSVRGWWFIKAYIILYIMHPYINTLLHKLSRDEYRNFLAAGFICWSIIPLFTAWPVDAGIGSGLDFVYVYAAGGYFRLWDENSGGRKFMLYGVLFMTLNGMTVLFMDIVGLRHAAFAGKALYFCGMIKPFTLLSAMCFFLGFRKLRLPQSRIINAIAGTSLGVYMLHINRFSSKFLWNNVFHTSSFQNSICFIPFTIGVTLAVHALCTVIDSLRSAAFRKLSGGRLS